MRVDPGSVILSIIVIVFLVGILSTLISIIFEKDPEETVVTKISKNTTIAGNPIIEENTNETYYEVIFDNNNNNDDDYDNESLPLIIP